MNAPTPAREVLRLASLRRLGVLDTPAERSFDAVAALAAEQARAPIALISLVDADRQWFKAALGLEVSETPRCFSFCAWAILDEEVFWVPDALDDARFADNPLVLGAPFIRFYAGAPIRLSDGERIGTVCVIDPSPRPYDLGTARSLSELAALAGSLFDLWDSRRRVAALETAAEAERAGRIALLKSLAHELLTPLNGVLGGAEALTAAALASSDRDKARLVATSARAMKTIVGELLETAALETGAEAALSEFNLVRLVREVLEEYAAAARVKGIELVFGPVPRLTLFGAAERIRQLLGCLLAGALAAAPKGRLVLDISHMPSAEGEEILVRIEDSGPPPSTTPGGEAFPTAGDVRQRSFDVSLKLARSLGAELRVGRGQKGGCETQLRLRVPHARRSGGGGPATEPSASQRTPLRILVADDHPANRKVASLILEPYPAWVLGVEDGAQALQALESAPFDLVLMDLQMPVMDGLAAIREIRRREAAVGAPRLPIIVLSAHVFPSDIEASYAAGADLHLGKPIDAAALVEAVHALCENRTTEEELRRACAD